LLHLRAKIRTAPTMAPLSEFRKAKFLHVFNTFFDVNRSGEIDENDLELAIKTVCEARGWAPSSTHYSKTRDTLRAIWDILTSKADKNNDAKVTVDEWNCMWKEGQMDQHWICTFRDLMFLLEDTSGDNAIDCTEFCVLYTALGVPEDHCREAFQRLSQGKPEISVEDFHTLWDEYFNSDNPEAPGNFIFGVTTFQ